MDFYFEILIMNYHCRNRDGIVPSLASRATLAAWPPNNNADLGNVDRSTDANTTPLQTGGLGMIYD